MDNKELNIKILESLLEIPKGKVTTYKNLAIKFGVHPRSISQIMKHNAFPEQYPCYKVISADGKVNGYSGIGGVANKVKKLKEDGVEVIDGIVDNKFII